jgi:hypothetical protein
MTEPLKIALDFLKRGWNPVPLSRETKKPIGQGWQKRRITTETVGDYFNGAKLNIGVQLGAHSDGLCDVDLDAPEALTAGAILLPKSNNIFGRQSKRRSHLLFRSDNLGDLVDKACMQFKDTRDAGGGMLLELRCGGGGKGAQSAFPGSVHTSGELVEWDCDGVLVSIDGDKLLQSVKHVAVATLLARHWPGKGGRHDAAMTVGGFLARAGLDEDEVVEMMEAIAAAAGDEEVADRVQAARDAVKQHADGGECRGLPAMIEEFGEQVVQKAAQWLGYRSSETKSSKPRHDVVEDLNSRYCVVLEGGKVRVLTFSQQHGREMVNYLTFTDFRNLFMNKYVMVGDTRKTLGQFWLSHPERRQYEGVVFDPSKPHVTDNKLNLWRGWGIEPKPGNWTLMRQHIHEVLASKNREHETYILNFAAWCVQHPEAPAEVALVFRGPEGTGRGIFARAMCRIFGQHAHQISSIKHLTGDFNKHLRDCCLLFADEAFWPGYRNQEGTLKRLITEPTLFIEPKGLDAFEVRNMIHLIMVSNNRWVIPAAMDARRFAMLDVAEHRKQSAAWFIPLYQQMEDGGYAAMLHDLLQRRLGDWHPRMIIHTAALHDQQMLSLDSLDPHDAWWFTLLSDGVLPGFAQLEKQVGGGYAFVDPNPRRALSHELYEHARKTVPRLKFESDHILGRALGNRGCRKFNNEGRGWEFPSLAEARAAWVKRAPEQTWDDDYEDWQEREAPPEKGQ